MNYEKANPVYFKISNKDEHKIDLIEFDPRRNIEKLKCVLDDYTWNNLERSRGKHDEYFEDDMKKLDSLIKRIDVLENSYKKTTYDGTPIPFSDLIRIYADELIQRPSSPNLTTGIKSIVERMREKCIENIKFLKLSEDEVTKKEEKYDEYWEIPYWRNFGECIEKYQGFVFQMLKELRNDYDLSFEMKFEIMKIESEFHKIISKYCYYRNYDCDLILHYGKKKEDKFISLVDINWNEFEDAVAEIRDAKIELLDAQAKCNEVIENKQAKFVELMQNKKVA